MLAMLPASGVCLRVCVFHVCAMAGVWKTRIVRECVCVCDATECVTVFEDTEEQGLVGLAVPPVSWDLGVERLGNPDIQLTVADITSHY